jgi:hypothetical protein
MELAEVEEVGRDEHWTLRRMAMLLGGWMVAVEQGGTLEWAQALIGSSKRRL